MTSSDPSVGEVGAPGEGPKLPARRRGPGGLVFAALGVTILVSALFAYAAIRYRDHQQNALTSIRASGIPASISTPLANLMELSPVPNQSAPDFTLTDQKGQRFSLSNFRGHAVVLEFMDPHCTDICPIVSQEFLDAYHDLGTEASRVVFLAVNVNPYHLSVSAMATYSRAHQLNTIPSWHFFTGSASALQVVWSEYGVSVQAPNPDADIIHTANVFFIDTLGRERYIATPMDDHTAQGAAYLPAGPLASWGKGIALVTRQFIG